MKHRILQVGKYYALKGGIETITRSFVHTLQQDNIIDVLCFSKDYSTRKNKVGTSTIFEAGSIFKFLSSPISFKFFSLFKALRNNYNIILIHTPNPLAAVALSLFPTNAKVIVQWHGDILNKGIFYFIFKGIERSMLKRANLILVTSSVYLEHSSPLKDFKHKSKVLALGINEDNLTSDPALVKQIQSTYNNKKIVFAFGRYVYYKGFKYLIAAAKYLPDDVVVLIGGHGPKKDFYEEEIIRLHLENKVFLIPELNENIWGSYYEACDIFCLPSYEKAESFGIVLLEAMSYSKPIVATNIPGSGTPWVNENGVSGLNVCVKNSQQIAKAIEKILFDTGYDNYCKNSRKRFEENFTEEKMVKRFSCLIDELFDKPVNGDQLSNKN